MKVGSLKKLLANMDDDIKVIVSDRDIAAGMMEDAVEALHVKDSTECGECLLIIY